MITPPEERKGSVLRETIETYSIINDVVKRIKEGFSVSYEERAMAIDRFEEVPEIFKLEYMVENVLYLEKSCKNNNGLMYA
jgi:hypothetical protein